MAIKLNRRAETSIERRHTHDADEITAKGGEVQWLASACGLCYAQCSILAKVKDGVIVKIEGNPDSPIGSGRLCPKGVAGIMTHYDPNRVNTPLMRTNPVKGLGVDPKWKTISWEEANEIILGKLRAIQKAVPHERYQGGKDPEHHRRILKGGSGLNGKAVHQCSRGGGGTRWSAGRKRQAALYKVRQWPGVHS